MAPGGQSRCPPVYWDERDALGPALTGEYGRRLSGGQGLPCHFVLQGPQAGPALDFFAQLVSVTRDFKGLFHRIDKIYQQITTINDNLPNRLPEPRAAVPNAGEDIGPAFSERVLSE